MMEKDQVLASLQRNALHAQIEARLTAAGIRHNLNFTPVQQPTPPATTTVSSFGSTPTTNGTSTSHVNHNNNIEPDLKKHLIIDSDGRTVDSRTGEEIDVRQYRPTLKVNMRSKRAALDPSKPSKDDKSSEDNLEQSAYFDPNIKQKQPDRSSKMFQFHEAGKFVQIAHKIRTKKQLKLLQQKVEAMSRRTGIASAAKLAAIQPGGASRSEELVPDIEWWDAPLLNSTRMSYDVLEEASLDQLLQMDWFTNLVEHPVQKKAPQYPSKPPDITLALTKKERRKLRRQNRVEMQKEKQEKQRLGLVPAPQPKLRMSNLMRALGSEAVQDPTKAEAFVRAQMDRRKRDHESANAARQLTTDQSRAKKIRKIKEDTSTGVHVSVYSVRDLNDPSHKFKVETNAGQLHMTGTAVIHKACCVVVVEGGPKQQVKFQKLMLKRIRWSEGRRGTTVNDNSCRLIWKGVTAERAFDKLAFKVAPSEQAAREMFKKAGVEHYWDQCYADSVLNTVKGGDSSATLI